MGRMTQRLYWESGRDQGMKGGFRSRVQISNFEAYDYDDGVDKISAVFNLLDMHSSKNKCHLEIY